MVSRVDLLILQKKLPWSDWLRELATLDFCD
jgi:hypothetical protein